jgi:hypothetical protein
MMQASLLGALSGRHRPLIVVIDGVDQAVDPEQTLRLLLEIGRTSRGLPLRVLVATRQRPQFRAFFDSEEETGATVRSVEVSSKWDNEDMRRYLTLSGYREPNDEEIDLVMSLLKRGMSLEKVVALLCEYFEQRNPDQR